MEGDMAGDKIDLTVLYGAPVTAATRRFDLHSDGFSIEDRWTAAAALPVPVEREGLRSVLRVLASSPKEAR